MREKIEAFFQTSVAHRALKHLKEKQEIGVMVEGGYLFAIYRVGNQVMVEERTPKKPDVIFEMTPAGLEAVVAYRGDEVGEVGILVVQQYIKGEVKIRAVGGLFSLLKNGYMGIIGEGGPVFMKYLAQHGVSNLSKIPELFKKLRS